MHGMIHIKISRGKINGNPYYYSYSCLVAMRLVDFELPKQATRIELQLMAMQSR